MNLMNKPKPRSSSAFHSTSSKQKNLGKIFKVIKIKEKSTREGGEPSIINRTFEISAALTEVDVSSC